jgi:predicted nucleic acid-binding protein
MTTPEKPVRPAITDIVVDASVVVKWFVPESDSEAAARFLSPLFRFHAPELLIAEVGQTLWKKAQKQRELDTDEAARIVAALATLPIELYSLSSLHEAAFEIASTTGRTVYDSFYLALGRVLGYTFVTADQKLFHALQETDLAKSVHWVGFAFSKGE